MRNLTNEEIELIEGTFGFVSEEVVKNMFEEGEVRLFENAGDFEEWMLEDLSKDELISMIVNGESVDYSQAITLESGEVIFVYI